MRPTIILQITMLLSVNPGDLYYAIVLFYAGYSAGAECVSAAHGFFLENSQIGRNLSCYALFFGYFFV